MKKKSILKEFYKHLLIFIFVVISGIYLIELNIANQKERYLQLQTELLNTKYQTNYKYYKIMSNDIYSMYQSNPLIINTMTKAIKSTKDEKAKLRKKLYNKLKRRYKRLQNMGVLQLQFHMPDNISFLRMDKPEKFGDNLSKNRYSVMLANKTKREQDGFEIGKVNHGFRFVYPLFNKKQHIGSLEISFSSEKLIQSVIDNYIIHSHFLILKESVEQSIFPELKDGLYQPSIESKDYLIDLSSHEPTKNQNLHKGIFNKRTIKEISKRLKTGEPFSYASYYNFNSIIGSFIPITNIQNNKTVAYLAIYNESDYLNSLIMEERYIKMLFISIIFLILLFSIYATITRKKLHQMAHFDELTNLPNRAYFYIELEQELKRANRFNQNLAVMFIDLDGFKAINDTYGHNVGDMLLQDVSKRLQNNIRDIDIVARLGGDEFTIVLVDIKTKEDTIKIANKLIDALSQEFILNKKVVNIGASIGISIYPEHGEDIDTLIKKADNSMYEAKQNGKNRAILNEEI